MRSIAALSFVVALSSLAAGPTINANISPKDVQEICATVKHVTAAPVFFIAAIASRSDLVAAQVHDTSDATTGTAYILQKRGDKWRITKKDRWIE